MQNLNTDKNELIFKTETDIQTVKRLMVTKGEEDVGGTT